MKATLQIGSHRIELNGRLTVTHLAGGAEVRAFPEDTPEYVARAEALGYGADTAAMSREHEITHALLARWLDIPENPTLRGAATGKHWPHWRDEEAAVLAIQKLARALGIDLVALARNRT